MPAGPLSPHLRLGRDGEDAAAAYLLRKGFRIVARNWRHKGLELDLVCMDGDTVIFVEVKTRGPGSLGTPADGLTREKARRIARAAGIFLSDRDWWQRPCRFDMLLLSGVSPNFDILHEENALDFAAAVGSRGSWQPW